MPLKPCEEPHSKRTPGDPRRPVWGSLFLLTLGVQQACSCDARVRTHKQWQAMAAPNACFRMRGQEVPGRSAHHPWHTTRPAARGLLVRASGMMPSPAFFAGS